MNSAISRLVDAFSDLGGSCFIAPPARIVGGALRFTRRKPLCRGKLNLEEIRSVLVVRLDGLGDVVLMSALLKGLRRRFPVAKITLLVDERLRTLVELCPWVDAVIGFEQSAAKHKRVLLGVARAWRFATANLHSKDFDLAINPRWDVDSRSAAVVGYLSLARFHLGFAESVNPRKGRLNRGLDRLFSHLVPCVPEPIHESERNSEVLAALGLDADDISPEVWLGDDDRKWAERVMDEHTPGSEGPVICVAPGAIEAKRKWPMHRFEQVIRWSVGELNARVIVIGDKKDQHETAQLSKIKLPKESSQGIVNLSGKCTLRQSAAILAHCDLFIGNDSGPMHVARAMRIPVIEISGHPGTGDPGHVNSPVRYGPRDIPHRILQPQAARQPCRNFCGAESPHCILDIDVPAVKSAIVDLIPSRIKQPRSQRELLVAD
jgi:ADP-heptose:LPS heptosyltransferase